MKTSEKHQFIPCKFDLNRAYAGAAVNFLEIIKSVTPSRKIELIIEANDIAQKGAEVSAYVKMAAIFYALDPRITYGVSAKKVREIYASRIGGGTKLFGNRYDASFDATKLLELLATRAITGNAAIAAIKEAFDSLMPEGAELLKRILCKDLECGVNVSTVNKAVPNYIFEFNVNLCKKFYEHHHKLKYPVWGDPKLDGVRCCSEVDPSGPEIAATLRSREGNVFGGFQEIEQTLVLIAGVAMGVALKRGFKEFERAHLVFEGELTEDSFYSVAGTIHRHEKGKKAIYKLFDIMPYRVFTGDEHMPFEKRRAFLDALAEELKTIMKPDACIQVLEGKLLNSFEEVEQYYEEQRAKGNEGAVIKVLNATYEAKRTDKWLKMKAEDQLDLRVVGYKQGEIGKKNEHSLGTLTVIYNGVEIEVSGFTEKWRQLIWDALQDPTEHDEVVGQIIEVEYHEETPDGSLRHPRFKRFRSGKFATDVKKAADDEDPEFGVF